MYQTHVFLALQDAAPPDPLNHTQAPPPHTHTHLDAPCVWPGLWWSWCEHCCRLLPVVFPLHHALNSIHVDLQLSDLAHHPRQGACMCVCDGASVIGGRRGAKQKAVV